MLVNRKLWLDKINQAWSRRSIVWLSGVRRVGKTTLAQMLPEIQYMNCDLPSVQLTLSDPELFWGSCKPNSVTVLDEVHRLKDPSLLLKIAADEYPNLKLLATGSSTLAATKKFRDSLTGRKEQLYLPPVLWEESPDWMSYPDLDRRLLHGGLPEALLAKSLMPSFFSEWLDSFFARDILELFNVGNREGFLTLVRLLFRQSGGQLDYTQLAKLSEMSRLTVKSYINSLQVTHAVHLLRPFSGGSKREIVSRPKCYGFDTGFVCFEKGWNTIRVDDRGMLWEHLVLDTLLSRFNESAIHYWRDKSQREIDFVIRRDSVNLDVYECKISPDGFRGTAVEVFRDLYPHGNNYIVSPLVKKPYRIRRKKIVFTVFDTSGITVDST